MAGLTPTPHAFPRTTIPSASGTPVPAPCAVLEPGMQVDRWEIKSVLGRGTTGIVYEVAHVQLRTRYAMKVLSWAHPELQARLLAEGRAQARLEHPNVVRVHDLVEVFGAPALLLELVPGPSLEEYLESHRPTVAEAEGLFRQIAAGVAHAHAHGIVHRDLKPGNVLMAFEDGLWVPKVTDFGLVKSTKHDLGLTQSGITMGTPAYMAPEQIRDARTVDQRADIFSLGCILYEMLSGKVPHAGDDSLTVLNAVADGDVRPIQSLVRGLPKRLARGVRGAMAVHPADRLVSVEHLLDVLDGRTEAWAPRVVVPTWLIWALMVSVGVFTATAVSTAIVKQQARARAAAVPVAVTQPLEDFDTNSARDLFVEDDPSFHVAYPPREPWVPDDVDMTLRPYVSPPAPPTTWVEVETVGPEEEPQVESAPDTVGPVDCRALGPGNHGWAQVPRRWRVPRTHTWKPDGVLPVYAGTPDAPAQLRCVVPAEAALRVHDDPIKGLEGRWIQVAGVDLVPAP